MSTVKAALAPVLTFIIAVAAQAATDFPVYPIPAEIELTGEKLDLADATIITPPTADPAVAAIARHLSGWIAERHGIPIYIGPAETHGREGGRIILGLASDPLVAAALKEAGLTGSAQWTAPEAYQTAVGSKVAVVAGGDPAGLFYGVQSLIQLVDSPVYGQGSLKGARISDKPFKPIRGVHVYLPARKDIPFFKNFIRLMAHYKINTIIIEVGGGMRLDKHPEINTAWEYFCNSFYDMGDLFLRTGEQIPLGPEGRFQASVHTELGGGRWLTKSEVRDIVDCARSHHMNVVPEIQSLTHAYYLAIPHREIAEIKDAEWPDSYDAANPKSYEILFDVIDEYLEVMEPEWVHIGHDEWRSGISGDTGKTFGEDVLKIYGYLQSKGVKTMMWADHFVHGHNAEAGSSAKTPEGVWYVHPSTESSAGIVSAEAKDILMFNWSWGFVPGSDAELKGYGWTQIFGNFSGAAGRRGGSEAYDAWPERLAQEGVLGAEMSTWCLADEFSFGQNGSLLNMLLSQNLLWSIHTPPLDDLQQFLADNMPSVREILSESRLPSLDVKRGRPGYSFEAMDLSGAVAGGTAVEGIEPERFKAGPVEYRGVPFRVAAGKGKFLAAAGDNGCVCDIPIDSHAAGVIFLQVSKDAVRSRATYFSNYPEDTAPLLGFYRVKYADGFIETIPIRYGRNIGHHQAGYGDQIYFAHTVTLGDGPDGKPVLAFAYEWTNPRPNRKIASVDLLGAGAEEEIQPILLGITLVKAPFTE